jgi:hypothetical protein
MAQANATRTCRHHLTETLIHHGTAHHLLSSSFKTCNIREH